MSDNTELNPGVGGDVAATDDIGGVKYQRVKLTLGDDGVNDGDVSAANPIPITGTISIGDVTIADPLPAGTNNIGDVDVLTLPALPAGNNNIGDVDIASIAAGDNNIGNVDIVTMPNVVIGSGTVTTVSTVSSVTAIANALPAGNNNIGDVDVASIAAGTNVIGKVSIDQTTDGTTNLVAAKQSGTWNVGTVTPGTGATNLGKAIDTALGATDTGVLALGVRDDALATLTEADNDVTPFRTNARGATWVALDSTAVQTVTLAASTGTQEVVGDVAHDAPAAGNPVLLGAYAKAAAPTDVSADADAVRLWALLNGALAVNVTAAGALIGGDASNGLDVDVTRVPTDPFGANADAASATGSISAKLRGISTALGVTALDLGSGTGGSRTLRVFPDTAATYALAAGTNAIGKLAANSGVDIGDVDVTTVGTITPGTAASSLGKAEDGGHSSGDVGVMALGVRLDTPVTNANASNDADYVPLITDNKGKLWTAGCQAEDVASGDGDRGVAAMAVRKATPANTSGTDGDYEFLQMNAGALWTSPLGFFTSVSTDITRPADTTAYAVNDCWSDSTSAPTSGGFTVTNAARKSGGSGIITDAVFCTSADPGTTLQAEMWLFNQAVTNVNDNSAWVISDAEAKTVVGRIPFTMVDEGNNGIYHAQNLSIGFTCSGSANLRFLIKVKNAYTPASAEVLTCTLKIIQID